MMLRRLAFVSGLAVLSAVSLAPKAGAQTVVVPFNGTIPNVCTFGAPTGGTLAQNTPTSDWIEGSVGVDSGGIGTAGEVTLTCSGGGTVSVGVPAAGGGNPAWTPAIEQALLQNKGNGATTTASSGANFDTGMWSPGTAPLTIPGNVIQTLGVAMVAGSNDTTGLVVVPGTYNYNVTVTAAPN